MATGADSFSAADSSASSGMDSTRAAAVLLVVGEPFSNQHKEQVLEQISKGFKSWDVEGTGCDINAELSAAATSSPASEDGPNGEKQIHYASTNLSLDVLINPQALTVKNKLQSLLLTPAQHRHLVYSGHAIQGSGDWVLQDDLMTMTKVMSVAKEHDIDNALKQQSGGTLTIHTFAEGHWNNAHMAKENLGKLLKVEVNPEDKLSELNGVIQFTAYLSNFVKVHTPRELLQSSEVVGNIRFSRPTLYVFPGCQGDSSLFGISGFSLLINGGYSRKSCFWDFARHLDRIDAVLLTHLSADNVFGISTALERKATENVHPEIGFVYFNASEKGKHSPNGDLHPENGGSHKPASLLVNLVEEGNRMIENMEILGNSPHPCSGPVTSQGLQPLNLYHKVGHGTLDMYILNPFQDAKELKDFFSQWNKHVNNFTSSKSTLKVNGKEAPIPLPNMASVCALLVWKPASATEKITRLLFPGNAPQHKLFEGLDKLKNVDIFQHAEVSEKGLHAAKGGKKGVVGKPKAAAGSKPPSRGSTPVAKVEPKRKVTSPKLLDKSTKDVKNGRKAKGKASPTGSLTVSPTVSTSSGATAGTVTATPETSSIEASPTKEPAPVVAAEPILAAAPAASLPVDEPPVAVVTEASRKKDEEVKEPEKPVVSPELIQVDMKHDVSPESESVPVSHEPSSASPEVPVEPESTKEEPPAESDLPVTEVKEAEPVAAPLVNDVASTVQEASLIDISPQVNSTDNASMPEADQVPDVDNLAPAEPEVMGSPEPLPDPAHYEPSSFTDTAPVVEETASKTVLEPEVPEQPLIQEEAPQQELTPELENTESFAQSPAAEQVSEPDLLADRPVESQNSMAEEDMSPQTDEADAPTKEEGMPFSQPDLIPDLGPSEPDFIPQKEEEEPVVPKVEEKELVPEEEPKQNLVDVGDAPDKTDGMDDMDDEKDVDTKEAVEPATAGAALIDLSIPAAGDIDKSAGAGARDKFEELGIYDDETCSVEEASPDGLMEPPLVPQTADEPPSVDSGHCEEIVYDAEKDSAHEVSSVGADENVEPDAAPANGFDQQDSRPVLDTDTGAAQEELATEPACEEPHKDHQLVDVGIAAAAAAATETDLIVSKSKEPLVDTEDYGVKDRYSELGVYDDDEPSDNENIQDDVTPPSDKQPVAEGNLIPLSTPELEQQPMSDTEKDVIGQRLSSSEEEPEPEIFGGEKPEGLPSPEEPPIDFEPEQCEQLPDVLDSTKECQIGHEYTDDKHEYSREYSPEVEKETQDDLIYHENHFDTEEKQPSDLLGDICKTPEFPADAEAFTCEDEHQELVQEQMRYEDKDRPSETENDHVVTHEVPHKEQLESEEEYVPKVSPERELSPCEHDREPSPSPEREPSPECEPSPCIASDVQDDIISLEQQNLEEVAQADVTCLEKEFEEHAEEEVEKEFIHDSSPVDVEVPHNLSSGEEDEVAVRDDVSYEPLKELNELSKDVDDDGLYSGMTEQVPQEVEACYSSDEQEREIHEQQTGSAHSQLEEESPLVEIETEPQDLGDLLEKHSEIMPEILEQPQGASEPSNEPMYQDTTSSEEEDSQCDGTFGATQDTKDIPSQPESRFDHEEDTEERQDQTDVRSFVEMDQEAEESLNLTDSLCEPVELQSQPEPDLPDQDMLSSMGLNPFSIVDGPQESSQACSTNPFLGVGEGTLLEPQVIPDMNGSAPTAESTPQHQVDEQEVERDSLEREQGEAFDPLKTWGQPMGLPAPPPPGGAKTTSKANSANKAGAASKTKSPVKKSEPKSSAAKGTSPVKKNVSSSKENVNSVKKDASKAVTNGAKKPADKVNGKKKETDAAKKPPPAAPATRKARPATAPTKADSKSAAKPGAKRAASAAATKAAPAPKPLPPVTPFYVNLTYIPNHGNAHYVDMDFFRRVRARYYVLSSIENAPHVLNALLEGKQTWENTEQEVTLIPTYDTETLRSWMVLNRDQLSQHKIDVAPSANRCTIQLQDHETSCSAYRLEF